MSHNPRQTIQRLIEERYSQAKVVFWAGSISRNQGTSTSDLDLVIVYEKVPHAYREAFVYEDWLIDTFVHDPETLAYFFEKVDLPSFKPALPNMIAEGIQFPKESELGAQLKQYAKQLLTSPPKLELADLNTRRFHITDSIDDLKTAQNQHEKIAITFALYENLAEFYLLANNQWIGSGKQLVRKLEAFEPKMAQQFFMAFKNPRDIEGIITLAGQILKPYGGFLWDGFRSEAPQEFKIDLAHHDWP